MREIRITSQTFRLEGEDPSIPDAYIDPATLAQVKRDAGIYDFNYKGPCTATAEHFEEQTLNKGAYQNANNIKPGTDEWFKLWFSRPNITGEQPTNKE